MSDLGMLNIDLPALRSNVTTGTWHVQAATINNITQWHTLMYSYQNITISFSRQYYYRCNKSGLKSKPRNKALKQTPIKCFNSDYKS